MSMRSGGFVGMARGYVDELLEHVRRVEIIDRAYTIAASAFVALIPLVIVITGLVTAQPRQSVVADNMITRLGLDGAAAEAVRLLLSGGSPGLYPLGLVIVLYSAFSLSKRIGRAYADIWEVPRLPLRQLWRGLVWVLVEVAAFLSVGWLREVAVETGPVVAVLAYGGAVAAWFGAELVAQRLLTMGQVAWRRLRLAAALVAVGRLGVSLWVVAYLSTSLARQAEQYGPIGVVFAIFSGLFAVVLVTLVGTLIAAVVTAERDGPEPGVRTASPASA